MKERIIRKYRNKFAKIFLFLSTCKSLSLNFFSLVWFAQGDLHSPPRRHPAWKEGDIEEYRSQSSVQAARDWKSGSKEPSVPTLLVPSACVSLFRRHAFPYFNSSFNRDTRSGQRHSVALTENQIERRLDPLFDRTHPFSQAISLGPKYETPLQRVGSTEVEDFIVRLLITERDVPTRGGAICLDKTDLAECEMQNRRCTLLSRIVRVLCERRQTFHETSWNVHYKSLNALWFNLNERVIIYVRYNWKMLPRVDTTDFTLVR